MAPIPLTEENVLYSNTHPRQVLDAGTLPFPVFVHLLQLRIYEPGYTC